MEIRKPIKKGRRPTLYQNNPDNERIIMNIQFTKVKSSFKSSNLKHDSMPAASLVTETNPLKKRRKSN